MVVVVLVVVVLVVVVVVVEVVEVVEVVVVAIQPPDQSGYAEMHLHVPLIHSKYLSTRQLKSTNQHKVFSQLLHSETALQRSLTVLFGKQLD